MSSKPARPVRLGVVGLGRAFTLMLPTFRQDPRIQLVAACDPRAQVRTQFEADFHAPAYPDAQSLARDASVEAVYIASPPRFHAGHVRVCARQGKHVLVEKPMALSLAECDAMIADCRAANVHLLVGHCHSFNAPYRLARDFIDAGNVGRVRMVHALNYTDFLYRPRRPDELEPRTGGGVIFSQAAHQVDIVRLLAGAPVRRVRTITGAWDGQRPVDGAYTLLMWFVGGAFASLTYSGYGHFDSDEWCGWTGEMGQRKNAHDYGAARRRLAALSGPQAEARLKADTTYGGRYCAESACTANGTANNTTNSTTNNTTNNTTIPPSQPNRHQHFGPVIVSCERADLRPLPDGVWVYADERREHIPLAVPPLPRYEVIDALHAAVVQGQDALHDGVWARTTLAVCLAMLESARQGHDVRL